MRSRAPYRLRLIAALACLAAAAPDTESAAQVIRAGPKTCRAVAFTFDLCPVRAGSGYDAALVAALVARRIPATFFLSGRWMATHDREVRALLAVPYFEVGGHGQAHAHLPLLSAEEQAAEIAGPITLLRTRYGRETRLVRPPYGEYDETTVALAARLGLRLILWNAVSGDPDPALSAKAMLRELTAAGRGGSIIVFHANGKGRHTREVVEALYEELAGRRGLRPVTVTELLDRCEPGARP
ncbi:polysaccharide deacetylase family protein [Nitrospira sp. Kam-Ns4a]